MSFSEFMQWLRNFFSSKPTPNSGSSGTGNTSSSSNAGASGSADSQATTDSSSTPETPTSTIPDTSTPTVDTPNPSAVTPPPLPETTEPVAPPTVTPVPEDTKPIVSSITTVESKVALNKEVVFQIVTEPANQYEDCRIDLSHANNASIVQPLDTTTGQFSLIFDKASSSDNDTQLVKVANPQGGSSLAVTVSLMKLFWANHPGRKNICDETLFVNQCAIRMGSALELSGIKLSQDRRVLRRCTTEYRAFKHHKDGLVKGHVLAAQELANWIKSQSSTFGTRHIVHKQEEILGRSGVIFFRDGWGTTDHIDVWDGQALVGGFPSYFDSDFKELWFWDVY